MLKLNRWLCIAAAASLNLLPGAAQAQVRGQVVIGPSWHAGWGHHGGGYWRGGRWVGGVSIAFGAPWAYGPYYYDYPYGAGWTPVPLVVAPRAAYYSEVPAAPPVPAAKAAPDPIFYPRSGQTPTQTEADRQACNRWATTQANAMSDASVFHRATLACMEGRGYVVK